MYGILLFCDNFKLCWSHYTKWSFNGCSIFSLGLPYQRGNLYHHHAPFLSYRQEDLRTVQLASSSQTWQIVPRKASLALKCILNAVMSFLKQLGIRETILHFHLCLLFLNMVALLNVFTLLFITQTEKKKKNILGRQIYNPKTLHAIEQSSSRLRCEM